MSQRRQPAGCRGPAFLTSPPPTAVLGRKGPSYTSACEWPAGLGTGAIGGTLKTGRLASHIHPTPCVSTYPSCTQYRCLKAFSLHKERAGSFSQ